MGQVLIRNLDDDLIAAYREAAERQGRSLEAELRNALASVRPRTERELTSIRERARQIRAMTPNLPQTPAEVLVREDRDGFREA